MTLSFSVGLKSGHLSFSGSPNTLVTFSSAFHLMNAYSMLGQVINMGVQGNFTYYFNFTFTVVSVKRFNMIFFHILQYWCAV